jgi:hypothetical protein
MSSQPSPPLFAPPAPDRSSTPLAAWAIAGAVLLLALGGLLLATHKKSAPPANTLLPLDPYAPSLVFSSIQMSESTSLSGGKSIFIDGHVRDTGNRTVTGATLQVLFPSFDSTQPPQLETLPLTLIRTHQPYIDTEPVSAAPIAPGENREFRLIFEDISPNWGQQLPEIHAVHIDTKDAAWVPIAPN